MTLHAQLSLSPPSQVCELDIIFNFEKAYSILDEFLMGGDVQDTSKKSVLKAIEQADLLQEVWARDSEEEEEAHSGGQGLPSPGRPACPAHRHQGPPLPVVSDPHYARLSSLPSSPDPMGWEVGWQIAHLCTPHSKLCPSPKPPDVSWPPSLLCPIL